MNESGDISDESFILAASVWDEIRCDLFAEPNRRNASPVFELARLLQGSGKLEPEDCETEVSEFCRENCLPFDDSWLEFNSAWPLVKFPNRQCDGLAVAFEHAISSPISLPVTPPAPRHLYILVASIAFHLSEYNAGNEFLLPVKRLCTLLNLRDPANVSRILKWLKQNRILTCVDDSYSFGRPGGGRCKKYILGELTTKKNEDHQRQPKVPRIEIKTAT